MVNVQLLEQELRKAIPAELHHKIPQLVKQLQEVIEDANNFQEGQQVSLSSPQLKSVLSALAGKELQTEAAILSFGSGNQIGDISIRDIAGGNVNHSNINVKVENKVTVNKRPPTPKNRPLTPEEREARLYLRMKKSLGSSRYRPSISQTNRVPSPKPPHIVAKDIYIGLKVLSFTIIGFLFGWYAIIAVTNTQYLYSSDYEFSPQRLIAGVVTGAIGLVIGLSFTSKRKRASGVDWWGHILGVGVAGAITYSLFRDATPGIFWIGGVMAWILFWVFALGGHKEIR